MGAVLARIEIEKTLLDLMNSCVKFSLLMLMATVAGSEVT